MVPSVEPLNPGTLIRGSSGAAGPASMTRIEESGRPRLRRAATARPAVPPPTIIYMVSSDFIRHSQVTLCTMEGLHLHNRRPGSQGDEKWGSRLPNRRRRPRVRLARFGRIASLSSLHMLVGNFKCASSQIIRNFIEGGRSMRSPLPYINIPVIDGERRRAFLHNRIYLPVHVGKQTTDSRIL